MRPSNRRSENHPAEEDGPIGLPDHPTDGARHKIGTVADGSPTGSKTPPAAAASPAPVFPLPFTPFENYYYLDDGAEYPTVFPAELRFSGTLIREHFQRALAEALERHPMLCAVVDKSGRRPAWVGARGEPQVDWADALAPIAHPAGESIDLTVSPGLRTWVRASPDRARVLFQFHHACCDGLAALQFLADFLAAYKMAAGLGAAGFPLGELDAELLRRRGEIVCSQEARPSLAIALRDALVTISVWARILFRAPEVLAAPAGLGTSAGTTVPQEILAFTTETLSREESHALRKLAGSLKATTNDLLVRDFLLVMRAWNRRHAGASRGRLRINVPLNVRRRDEARMPAANRIGYGFVTAKARGGDDPRRLLDSVLAAMRRIKEWKLGLYFLGGLAVADNVPGVLPWALGRNRSFATAVLSNVGRFAPDRSLGRDQRWTCGELVLERVTGVPPIRKLTRAAIIVIEYGGETTICLRCDPHCFDAAQTRALLDEYVAAVRETLRRGN